MTELGQTGDPRVLVPGRPADVQADAAALLEHGRRVGEAGLRLRGVHVEGWDGLAGARFAESWARQPPAWSHLADALNRAGAALSRYLELLRWAQDQAAAAIELWERGGAEEPRAGSGTRPGVRFDIEQGRPRNPEVVETEPDPDPSEAIRDDARQILDDARERLRAAGDALARDLLTAFGDPDRLDGALAPLDRVTAAGSASTGFRNDRGVLTAEFTSGPDAGATLTPPGGAEGGLGGLDAHARVAHASVGGAYQDGDLVARLRGDAAVGTLASAAASSGPGGVTASAEVSGGAKASTELDVRHGALAAHTRLEGRAGAGIAGTADAGRDGLRADVDAFAGGRVGVGQSVEIGGITVGTRAEGMAGAGFTGALDIGFTDGRFRIGGRLGGALGLGGSVGGELSVDPDEVAENAVRAADALGRSLPGPAVAGAALGPALALFD